MKNRYLNIISIFFILNLEERKFNMRSLGTFKDKKDNSLKSVFDCGENKIIEMTLLFNKEKLDVVCAPTHIAGMPVAVNISCHVTRHAEEIL